MDGVQVRSALTAMLDRDQTNLLELGDVAHDGARSAAHVFGQPFLAGEALIQITRVLEQHGVGEFSPNRYFFVFQDKIRYAGPPALRGNVRPFQAQVAVFEGS